MHDTPDISLYKNLQVPLRHLISSCCKTQLRLYIIYYIT
nr:MAG TPA: hypothetical protein [Caudoviricetes sp.]